MMRITNDPSAAHLPPQSWEEDPPTTPPRPEPTGWSRFLFYAADAFLAYRINTLLGNGLRVSRRPLIVPPESVIQLNVPVPHREGTYVTFPFAVRYVRSPHPITIKSRSDVWQLLDLPKVRGPAMPTRGNPFACATFTPNLSRISLFEVIGIHRGEGLASAIQGMLGKRWASERAVACIYYASGGETQLTVLPSFEPRRLSGRLLKRLATIQVATRWGQVMEAAAVAVAVFVTMDVMKRFRSEDHRGYIEGALSSLWSGFKNYFLDPFGMQNA